MKLKDLLESAPFVKFGSWTMFDVDIEGMGVPVGGPALLAMTSDGRYELSLGTNEDEALDQIIVWIRNINTSASEFEKMFPDTDDGYKLAKKYAEKLRKGEDPTK